jgi:hypothetical protein
MAGTSNKLADRATSVSLPLWRGALLSIGLLASITLCLAGMGSLRVAAAPSPTPCVLPSITNCSPIAGRTPLPCRFPIPSGCPSESPISGMDHHDFVVKVNAILEEFIFNPPPAIALDQTTALVVEMTSEQEQQILGLALAYRVITNFPNAPAATTPQAETSAVHITVDISLLRGGDTATLAPEDAHENLVLSGFPSGTQWTWDLTPRQTGEVLVGLSITVDDQTGAPDHPTRSGKATIEVVASLAQTTGSILNNAWVIAILSAVCAAAIITIVGRLLVSQHRQRLHRKEERGGETAAAAAKPREITPKPRKPRAG